MEGEKTGFDGPPPQEMGFGGGDFKPPSQPTLSAKQIKLPPQNIEAERQVLGSMLIDGEAVDKVLEHVDASDFYVKAHQTIFNSVVELNRQGSSADLITVSDYLQAQNLLQTVGGTSSLASLVDTIVSSANVESYAKLIREKAVLRRLIQVGTSIIEESYQGAPV